MLYITYNDLNRADLMGIKKKVITQILAFKKKFKRTYYTFYAGQMMYLMDEEKLIEKQIAVTKKECNWVLCKWIEKYDIERIYIRYNLSNAYFLKFLKYLKEKQIKTVLEIPTYPYDGELGNNFNKMEDVFYRKQLREYVDLIATYTNDHEIWDIRCVNLRNGIDIKNIPVSTRKREENTIYLIAVSSMAPWHGYERILEGLYHYYQEKNRTYKIFLRFIGEGGEEHYYKSLTEKYNLQPYVIFCGKMLGKDLDEQFELSDIAVGSLGMYKTGIYEGNPIKGAEYCARGIPFIYGYDDTRFSPEQEFTMRVLNDRQAINIKEVIAFYEKIVSKQGYQKIMRDYAAKCLTWENIMEPVINYFADETAVR